MKVHALSDYSLCVGGWNPDPSNSWATKLDEVWNERGSDEKLDFADRDMLFVWHVL